MLIAIAILALAVVYMASKPAPGTPQGTAIPQQSTIPAQGTNGVPSPATTFTPAMATAAAQVVLAANHGLPFSHPTPLTGPVELPPPGTVSSAPVGPPDQQASLRPSAQLSQVSAAGAALGYRKI